MVEESITEGRSFHKLGATTEKALSTAPQTTVSSSGSRTSPANLNYLDTWTWEEELLQIFEDPSHLGL